MGDLLLFTSWKKSHIVKLEDLPKKWFKNGPKICQKKYQLFRTELQYMGNKIFMKDRRVCIKPLRSRFEATQKLQPLTTAKGMYKHCGNGKCSEYVLSRITVIMKAIYDLTRKGRHS